VPTDPGGTPLTILGIPAGETVTIDGMYVQLTQPDSAALVVAECDGAVRLSRCLFEQVQNMAGDPTSGKVATEAVIIVGHTASFWLSDSAVWPDAGGPYTATMDDPVVVVNGIPNDGVSALVMEDSEGVIQNSRLKGYSN